MDKKYEGNAPITIGSATEYEKYYSISEKSHKGNIAELTVAADLLKRGYKVAFPYGEDSYYDLLVHRGERWEQVQVKYVHEIKNGRIRIIGHSSKRRRVYNSELIDCLAAYCRETNKCYYIPSDKLTNKSYSLRVDQTKNRQKKGVWLAKDFEKW